MPQVYSEKGIGIIPYDGWYYAPNQIRRYTRLLSISHDGSEGIYREMDRARFKSLYRRYKADLKLYKKNKNKIEAQYREARSELTSVDFWKKYLGLRS